MESHINQADILQLFNNREEEAFGTVYLSLYDELYGFAWKLYNGANISIDDAVQDTFVHIWENRKLTFDSLKAIKAYSCIVIKNRFLKFLRHQKVVARQMNVARIENDRFITAIAENEVISLLRQSAGLLPAECAKVFALCIEGWSIKEIAEKQAKAESTVYKQRNEAIRILKKRLPPDKLYLLLFLLQ